MSTHHELATFCNASEGLLHQNPTGTQYAYIPALPTPCFSEIVTQVSIGALPMDPNVTIYVIPEISMDAHAWKTLTADQFGPISGTAPWIDIKKQTEVGLFQRFAFKMTYGAPGYGTAGLNAVIASIMRGWDPGSGGSGEYWDCVEYLDEIRRGIADATPPGEGRLIPFWPHGAAMSTDDGSAAPQTIYTPMFPMHTYRRLIVQLTVNSFAGGQGASLTVLPITTVTGHPRQYVQLPGSGFTSVTELNDFPVIQTVEVTPNGTMTGLALVLQDASGMAQPMVADLSIMGLGVG